MAVALLGYFTAMVTAFFGFMFLLSSVLSSSFVQQVHLRRPYPTPAVVATATVPDERDATHRQPAITAEQLARAEMARQAHEDATAKQGVKEAAKETAKETTKEAAAEKSKRTKVAARSQRRKQELAGWQQERDYPRQGREYSMALGYAQDGQRPYGGGPFGGGQFGGGQSGGMFGQFGTRHF